MRILLTGASGQVGWELRRTLAPLGRVTAADRRAADLADPASLRRAVREANPALIVNAAAYTAVDGAEKETDLAMAVNGVAPGILAEECARLGAPLVHFSTAYVFDGSKAGPYTEDDTPAPVNAYGASKLAGERAIEAVGVPHLILRTSWVYGLRGRNFLLTICRLARERDELRIVDDQRGAPTWSRLIAEAAAQLVARAGLGDAGSLGARSGVYHLAAGGATSWCGFARAILEAGPAIGVPAPPRLVPISTAEYPTPARRPANSCLAGDKLARVFGLALPAWDEGLRLCVEEAAR